MHNKKNMLIIELKQKSNFSPKRSESYYKRELVLLSTKKHLHNHGVNRKENFSKSTNIKHLKSFKRVF